jgi:hypothetical protein
MRALLSTCSTPGPPGFQRDHLPLRLNADQPCGCHNRVVLFCVVRRYDLAFALKAIPDRNLIKQAKQVGAIQLAGEVKACGERRRVRSDWMAVERGVSAGAHWLYNHHSGRADGLAKNLFGCYRRDKKCTL